jgi:ADP-ribosyl-[dinitrogen reductase] hydrolase
MPPPRKKKEGPAAGNAAVILDRFKGALMGLCVGDALGLPSQGRESLAEQFPQLNTGPLTEMRRTDTTRLGQTSAISEMAEALANCLRNEQAYDVLMVAKAYRKYATSLEDLPEQLQLAETERLAIAMLNDGRNPELTGLRVWLEGHQRVRDGGALSRALVLAAYYAHPTLRILRHDIIATDTAVSHFEPLCQLASATLGGVVAAAIHWTKQSIDADTIQKTIETELSYAAAALGRKHTDWVSHFKDCADWLRDDVKAAKQDDPELYGPELHLFRPVPPSVRVVFRLVLWELFHATSFESALLDVMNRGGQSALNGAITGALFGAVFGESAIPARWKEAVLECRPSGRAQWHVSHLLTTVPKGPLAK